jgi:20S proteasome alpha/beta subunit
MTIALGIIASDGLVIAADTQETYAGVHKVEQCKVLSANHYVTGKSRGAISASGAGSAGQLDSINEEICEAFLHQQPMRLKVTRANIKQQISEFQREHIAPFALLPDYERPSVSLIIGASAGQERALWTSDKSTLRQCRWHGAVGIGAPQANGMLTRFWAYENIQFATLLAIYILFNVKQQVDGCGKQTQVVQIRDNQAAYYPIENIAALEEIFGRYQAIEEGTLRGVLGASASSRAASILAVRLFREEIGKAASQEMPETFDWRRYTPIELHRGGVKKPVEKPIPQATKRDRKVRPPSRA